MPWVCACGWFGGVPLPLCTVIDAYSWAVGLSAFLSVCCWIAGHVELSLGSVASAALDGNNVNSAVGAGGLGDGLWCYPVWWGVLGWGWHGCRLVGGLVVGVCCWVGRGVVAWGHLHVLCVIIGMVVAPLNVRAQSSLVEWDVLTEALILIT